MDCIFCKIAQKEIPSNLIYEDEVCIAFHDIEPQAPVHFLVVPKNHCDCLTDGNGTELGHIMSKIPEIAQSLGSNHFRVVTNNGEEAGQTVPHLHFHVLSGRPLAWPPG